ncbi:hypothetical protein BD324DRAFT_628968 [Kockovaella imperatae]|uniref:Uncharacterized protein n=1 Tax=Kockovaella imperatae TaxID=4999 RepID=A0A1Y1UG28_9TREE|nr:hypothetical protein BD324DRAFT_628968 [Kockovaella imperatae]ORX36466.1 hypothetical protein BD324DRAFT_628968 [Kockovaella imperatae]
MGIDAAAVGPFLGKPSRDDLVVALGGQSSSSSSADIKSYPDAVYHNHYSHGFSCCFNPTSTNSPDAVLSQVDIFNPPSGSVSRKKASWTGYTTPSLPIVLRFPTTSLSVPTPDGKPSTITRPDILEVEKQTTGKDFVACLGEPSRKGGGQGFVSPWLEWGDVELKSGESSIAKVGIMVELRDPGAHEVLSDEQKTKGAGGVWDRASGWTWGSLKLFDPNDKR